MVHVRERYQQIQSAGGQAAVVCVGQPEQMAEFREQLKLPFTCLVDPERQAYKAFHLARFGLLNIMGPAVLWPLIKAFFRTGGGKLVSDPLQQQGEFLIDTEGAIRLAHYPVNSADRLSIDRIIAEMETLSAGRE